MSQLTLPRLARKRRDVDAEATIPCATAHVAPAAHLMDDRHAEPTFDDLVAGNRREPSHADLLDTNNETPEPAARKFRGAYPGVGADTLAWMREQDRAADDQRNQHAFDVDHLVPASTLRPVDVSRVGLRRVETPVADLCAAVGLLYAKRHTAALVGVSL